MSRNKARKKTAWLVVLLVVLGIILLAAAAYVTYLFVSYERQSDGITLEVSPASEGQLPDAVQVGTTYTVITQNVGFGVCTPEFTYFADDGEWSGAEDEQTVIESLTLCAAHLSDYEPDFILLQSVDRDATRSLYTDQPALFREQFPGFCACFAQNWDSPYFIYPFKNPLGFGRSGMMTLSDVKVNESVRRRLPVSESLTKILDLDRCYTITRVPTSNGRELVLINVHLSAYFDAADSRRQQLSVLASEMKAEYEKGNYVICGGTFNFDFTGDSVSELNRGASSDLSWAQPQSYDFLPEHFTALTEYSDGRLYPTVRNRDIPYEDGAFTAVTDGFIVSDNLSVDYLNNIQTGFAYSDHNPVIMRFTLNE